ncbi:hypothetical protein [Caudoviricetes sp.]|nr:hypothetical protein [Caudoviricetes sp.]
MSLGRNSLFPTLHEIRGGSYTPRKVSNARNSIH